MIPERTISIPELYTDLATNAFAVDSAAGDRVGLEAEFFLLNADRLDTPDAQVTPEGGRVKLFEWLHHAGERGGWRKGEGYHPEAPCWSTPGGSGVTLEPGGQIEISTPPMATVDEALGEVARWESFLAHQAETDNLLLLATGYNDRLGGATPRLVVRKPRYLRLAEHYDEIGPWGEKMMRSTCSTQVNLDFGRPDVAMRRWRLAVYLSQVLPVLFSTTERNYRSTIWRGSDPSRSGLPEGITGSDPISAYLDFALDATVVFVDDLRTGCFRPSRPVSFREWIGGTDAIEGYPDADDWRTHLTTLFPDVRPRGFIEIRSLDSMPRPQRDVAVRTLVTALYSEAKTDELLEVFEGEQRGGDPFRLRRSLVYPDERRS